MKLKEFRVREFRSIWDSDPVKVDDKITCLVGKNESGKTALLSALYRTNPVIGGDADFDLTEDYPRKEVENYRFAIDKKERGEVVVVDCCWKLEDSDLVEIEEAFGDKVLESKQFQVKTYYGKSNGKFVLNVNEAEARKHLAGNADFSEDLKSSLKSTTTWEAFGETLASAEETEAVRNCKSLFESITQSGLNQYIYNSYIHSRIPKFLYFDDYYKMTGRENINSLIVRKNEKKLKGSDHPLLGLINLARLDIDDLVNISSTTELKNKIEGAGNYLTRQIIDHWSQNKHLQMRFDVRDAKPEDPEGMREGTNIWGEVYDNVHLSSTSLASRSRGFVWFFSFLAWYEDVKRQRQNVILLLDEPGLSLHGRAQGDLLKYFESELKDHQLIYSTHSPFMIDPNHFGRVRIVQDLGIDTNEQLPKEEDGTKVLSEVFGATDDTLFPLQGALGYEIHQTLFVGPNSLVVEGVSDMLYLKSISGELEREGRIGLSEKWTITPVGGSGKVPTFVALLGSQSGMKVATLLDIQKGDRPQIENLYKEKLLKKKHVMTYADFLPEDCCEADVEDVFDRDFYVSLVNQEFDRELQNPIETNFIDNKNPRVVKAIEDFINNNPLRSGKFGHYRPARYFSENISELWPTISEAVKSRFESIFKQINGLL